MKNYSAKSEGFKKFELFDAENLLIGSLRYEKWYSYNVELNSSEGISHIKLEGFWGSKMVQTNESGEIIRKFKLTWTGIAFEDISGRKYFLKMKSSWKFQYLLVDEQENELLAATQDFKWKLYHADISYEVADHFNCSANLLLAVTHCINYLTTLTVSSTAAIVAT